MCTKIPSSITMAYFSIFTIKKCVETLPITAKPIIISTISRWDIHISSLRQHETHRQVYMGFSQGVLEAHFPSCDDHFPIESYEEYKGWQRLCPRREWWREETCQYC